MLNMISEDLLRVHQTITRFKYEMDKTGKRSTLLFFKLFVKGNSKVCVCRKKGIYIKKKCLTYHSVLTTNNISIILVKL